MKILTSFVVVALTLCLAATAVYCLTASPMSEDELQANSDLDTFGTMMDIQYRWSDYGKLSIVIVYTI